MIYVHTMQMANPFFKVFHLMINAAARLIGVSGLDVNGGLHHLRVFVTSQG